MKSNRRNFIKYAGMLGAGMATIQLAEAFPSENMHEASGVKVGSVPDCATSSENLSVIGAYGDWAVSLNANKISKMSFRRKEWTNLEKWKKAATKLAAERICIPDIGGLPQVTIDKKYIYDGLQIEELSWQLPYGRRSNAILLKPANATGKLSGIMAFHDHGGKKYFGARKITKTSDSQHPLIVDHQKEYYSGLAWANEVARRGYVVMVADAFMFANRRVMLADVLTDMRDGLNDDNPEDPKNIQAYNNWAIRHEETFASALFCAGTTFPGAFFAEDKKALDILCTREDVDAGRIGCGGLSGGGMRTIFMGGLDSRIKCAVCVGFMTTWADFARNKSYTHTWMTYAPLLPNDLDLPEILGLRVPLPTLVLNDIEDDLFTLSEMKRADQILKEVYEKADAANKYKCSFYPGIHKFDIPMQAEAFDWFDKWLKP